MFSLGFSVSAPVSVTTTEIFDSSNLPKYVNKEIVLKIFDEKISKDIINKNQEKHLINLKKSLNTQDFYDIIKVYVIYMKCIKKKYITANLAKDLFNYCNISYNDVKLHHLYSLVGDYWNIDKNHDGVALCYYGDWEMCEVTRLPEKVLFEGPREPHSILRGNSRYKTDKIDKIFKILEESTNTLLNK